MLEPALGDDFDPVEALLAIHFLVLLALIRIFLEASSTIEFLVISTVILVLLWTFHSPQAKDFDRNAVLEILEHDKIGRECFIMQVKVESGHLSNTLKLVLNLNAVAHTVVATVEIAKLEAVITAEHEAINERPMMIDD